jgi:hypothetical protein
MPKAPSPPPPIDVAKTTAQSQATNLQTGQENQALSTIGQNNPFGSLSYTTSIDPITGLPKYVANSSYSPEQQALLDQLQQSQQGIGGTAGSAVSNLFEQYGQDPNLVGQAGSLTNQALDAQMPAWERFNAPARAQLDTQLRNSGILPGTPAYQQQVDALTQQQQLNQGQWLSNFQPQAFQEAQSQYELPLQNVAKMLGLSQPAQLPGQLVNTPGANIGGTDVSSIAQASQNEAFKNYQQQVASQNANMGMGAGLVSNILKLPTGAGSSFGGDMMSNIFSMAPLML